MKCHIPNVGECKQPMLCVLCPIQKQWVEKERHRKIGEPITCAVCGRPFP